MKPKAIHLLKHLDIQLYDKKYKYFQNFLHALRENLTNDQITQNIEHDLRKNYSMVHNRLFWSQY